MKRHFDNTVEKDSAPKWYTGKFLLEMIKNIQVVFGKGTVGTKEKENSNFNWHAFQEAINIFQVPSILEGS
jgi:hypothetical protein